MRARSEAVFRFAAPFRAALTRLGFALVLSVCGVLILRGRSDLAGVERARAQAVHGLRGKRDQAAGAQDGGRLGDRGFRGF